MIDPTVEEIKAMEAASLPAGEYLESIGKTDLAALTYEEWMTFIEAVCTNYQDFLTNIDKKNIPF